jgi:hypothetical protein
MKQDIRKIKENKMPLQLTRKGDRRSVRKKRALHRSRVGGKHDDQQERIPQARRGCGADALGLRTVEH